MSEAVTPPENPIERYMEELKGKNENTLKNIRVVSESLSEWADSRGIENVLAVEKRDVRDFLSELYHDEGYAASTIRQKQMSLRSFFGVYTEGEREDESGFLPKCLSENPARFNLNLVVGNDSTEAEKQKHVSDNDNGVTYLERSEVKALIDAVPKPKIRNSLAIKLLVQTGARNGEVCNLKVDSVNREDGTVTIPDTKNGGTRTVPYQNLDPELTMWLDNGFRDRFEVADDSEYLLVGKQSGQLSEVWLGTMVRESAYSAGIQEEYGETADGNVKRKVTPHALRSTFCVQIFKQTSMSVPEVMQLTGHTRMATVEDYAEVAREDAVDALQQESVDFGTE